MSYCRMVLVIDKYTYLHSLCLDTIREVSSSSESCLLVIAPFIDKPHSGHFVHVRSLNIAWFIARHLCCSISLTLALHHCGVSE